MPGRRTKRDNIYHGDAGHCSRVYWEILQRAHENYCCGDAILEGDVEATKGEPAALKSTAVTELFRDEEDEDGPLLTSEEVDLKEVGEPGRTGRKIPGFSWWLISSGLKVLPRVGREAREGFIPAMLSAVSTLVSSSGSVGLS